MTVLIIHGGEAEINLNSEARGVYNLTTYEMGLPRYEVEPDSDEEVDDHAVDTLTLTIAATDRKLLSTYVGRLFRVLRQATDYWIGMYNRPVFLSTKFRGQDIVYATIVDFDFHQLPDPYNVNDRVIQDATLTLTRLPWSDIAPQYLHGKVVDHNGTEVDPAPYAILGYQSNVKMTVGDTEDAIYMMNGRRFGDINTIYTGGSLPDVQPGTMPNYAYGWNDVGTNPFTYIGAVSGIATQFTGLAFDVDAAATGITSLEWRYGMGDLGGSPLWSLPMTVTDYCGKFESVGDHVAFWPRKSDWVKQTINGTEGYWIKLTMMGDNVQSPNQRRKLIHAPSMPWLDIDTNSGGDLDTRLRIAIKCFNQSNTNPLTVDDYINDDGIMSRLIVAGIQERMSPAVGGVPTLQPGFYNFYSTGTGGAFEIDFRDATQHDTYDSPSGSVAQLLLSQITNQITGNPKYVYPLTAKIHAAPGEYRAFLRYKILDSPAPTAPYGGELHFNLIVSPEMSYGIDYKRSITRTVSISTQDDYAVGSVNVLDFGTVRLAPTGLRPGNGYQSYVTIQMTGTRQQTGTIWFYDLILLPSNEHFCLFDGSRTPEMLNAGHTAAVPAWQANQQLLSVDHLMPDGPSAAVLNEEAAWGAAAGITEYDPLVYEPFVQIGHNTLGIRPSGVTRLYFFFYKVAPNGIMRAPFDFKYAVRMIGANRYVSLPQSR